MSHCKNLIGKNKLVSVSLLALLTSSYSGSAWTVLDNRTTVADPAITSTGNGFDQDGLGFAKPIEDNSLVNMGNDINADENVVIQVLNVTAAGKTFNVSPGKQAIIGSHIGTDRVTYTLGAGAELILNGAGVTDVDAQGAVEADGTNTAFNAGDAVDANTYNTINVIDFGAAPSSLTISSADANITTDLQVATVLNGDQGTLNIINTGATAANDVVIVQDASWAAIKTINVQAGGAIRFYSTPTNATTLELQQTNDSVISLPGDSTLQLISANGSAENFQVMNGSLGATGGDNNSVIYLNVTDSGDANAFLTSNAPGTAVPVVGFAPDNRARRFVVRAGNGITANIDGQIFAKRFDLQGGDINFSQTVNVGVGGTTNFTISDSSATLSKSSNLGTTTFGAFPGNVISVDTSGGANTLTGNFTGDANPDNTSRIIFQGNNPGALVAATNADVTTNVTSIENLSNQNVTLAAGNYGSDLNLTNIDAIFTLADGFNSSGNVNVIKINDPLAPGGLAALGNATFAGNIGTGGDGIGDITLANDANKIFTVGGILLHSNSINFGENGGTLKLSNVTGAVGVDVFGTIILAADQTGVIDASNMTEGQTFTIHSIVGNIGGNSLGSINMSGGADLALEGGDVNATILMSNTTALILNNDNYQLVTQNNPNNGIVAVRDGATPALKAGTTLGSAEAPLKEFALLGDDNISISNNVTIVAQKITNAAPNQGQLTFFGGEDGVAIISGPIGTLESPLNDVALVAGSVARFTDPAFFSENTSINQGSTLQIQSNYNAASIYSEVD